MDHIKLNDILKLDNLKNVKVRFNLMFAKQLDDKADLAYAKLKELIISLRNKNVI